MPNTRRRRESKKFGLTFSLGSFHDPAVAQLDDAIAVGRVLIRVCDLNDGCAFAVQLLEQLHDFFALAGMEVPCWFIGQDHFRIGNDRARHADELLLAAGQLTRIKIALRHHLKLIERVGHDRAAFDSSERCDRKAESRDFRKPSGHRADGIVEKRNRSVRCAGWRAPSLSN